MNIGIDVRKLQDYGIGTHIRNVILYAANLAPAHRFFLYGDPRDAVATGENLTWIPESSPKYSLQELFALSGNIVRQNIGLFHSPHYTLPFRLSCKAIVTVHDLIHFKFDRYFPFWKVKAAEFVLRRAVTRADLILTVSKTSRDDLLQLFPGAANKTEVLYNRIDGEWFLPPPAIKLPDLGIPKNFLLYVGNFKKHKGLDLLAQAYRNLKERPPLVLVGSSGRMDSDLAEKVFSTPGIRVLGFAAGALLRKLYSEAMLFVFPSLYEGFGYPPLEAMACRTAVLSSDAPALKEILQDSAEFFERGNLESLTVKLEKLIQEESLRTALITRGMQRAKMFASEDSPRRLLEIYEKFKD